MRVAGVRLPDGRMVWADAGTLPVGPLDTVIVREDREESRGVVFVAPEQVVAIAAPVIGSLVEIVPRDAIRDEFGALPGAEMPHLGAVVETSAGRGRVIGLDPPHHRLTVRGDDGAQIEVTLDDIISCA